MPADVLDDRQPKNTNAARFHQTRLYVEGLPLREFGEGQSDAYVRAIPTDLLMSLKMAPPELPLTTRLGPLKQLLLASPRLETFDYEDRGQGTRFSFAEGERLPPFRDLRLVSYDWDHDRDAVARHWDFSRVRALELVDVPAFNFLRSVSFPDLAGLHTLHIADYSAHLPDRRQDATRGLHRLVRDHVRALRVLCFTCHTALFPLDAILAHAASLEELRLRDHVGFGDEQRRCPTLRAADVEVLARALANLHTLELDLDAEACDDPAAFLRALCAFPRLRTLTLHVQTLLRPMEFDEEYGTPRMVVEGDDDDADDEDSQEIEEDRDYEAARWAYGLLVRGRPAALVEEGRAVPWRSITINVGGWRRNMVRRLSEAWRWQNARGVFAERCFVLERDPASSYLHYVIRNVSDACAEMSVDDTSRTVSPAGAGVRRVPA